MKTNTPEIVYNAIRTPDGTVLQSRHLHDFVTYTDANKLTYMVDGGHSYLRRSAQRDDPRTAHEEISLYSDASHAKIRACATWGRLNTDTGDHEWIIIKNLDTDHIRAILDGRHAGATFAQILTVELAWRGEQR